MENLELKSPVIKIKNSLKELNGRFELAEEGYSKWEDKTYRDHIIQRTREK